MSLLSEQELTVVAQFAFKLPTNDVGLSVLARLHGGRAGIMVRKEGKSTVSIEDLHNSCLGHLNYDLCFVSLGLVRVLVPNNIDLLHGS
ncbi:hypothetical protein TIFTF001_027071 [Ficus carica]|uniref:Uncharacterized protein n=1 Tax=Ficus carica TaxID=3494 RepID=A0AA88IZ23_FICCA|nr:hypothetical protein TIFTF001_027071 [Ficus carica]